MDSIRIDLGQRLQGESGNWYRNLHVLGKGGNATTQLVVATSGLNKGVPFAAKIFRRLSRPERQESFLREFQFLRQCDHPCVMRAIDEGVYDDVYPFLVAEYLPQTLAKVIRDQQAPFPLKLSFVLQLLSALCYLSTFNPPVVHRDIKPTNVFVKGHSVVLGDFGLMKRLDVPVSEDQAALKESLGAGMPLRYRTPDLVSYFNEGTLPTPKSDVFQLGLVAAELFTGRNPLRESHSFSSPIELKPIVPSSGKLPAVIANLISRMLEVNFEIRESAATFLDLWLGAFNTESKSLRAPNKLFSRE